MACRFCNLQMPCCLDCKEKDCAVRCSGVLSKASSNKKCEWYSTYKAKNKCLRVK
jgi:hypothetical protein